MKKFSNIYRKAVVLGAVFVSLFSNAQVTDGQYQLSITNATATSNTIDVTLAVKVVGPAAGMRIFGFQTSINFDSAIINGGTITASYVGGRSAELSGMSFGTLNTATAGTLRIPNSSYNSEATSVDMAQGTTFTLGTYRISNTANWASGNANLWLQDVNASGRTRSAVNGYPYGGNSASQYSYTTTTPVSPPGLVLSHSSTSTYSLPLGTLSNAYFDSSSFKCYPNEVIDVLNIESTKQITEVKVFNANGQAVLIKQLNASATAIDFSNFPSGNYILQATNEDGNSKTFKLIKK